MVVKIDDIEKLEKEEIFHTGSSLATFKQFKAVLKTYYINEDTVEAHYIIYEKKFFLIYYWSSICIGTFRKTADSIEECKSFVRDKWDTIKNIPVYTTE